MGFKLTELYAELTVKGLPTIDQALAKVRMEMVRTQRIARALGGELGGGFGIVSELFRKATQQRLEPQLLRMQANLLAATGKMKGWSQSQGLAVASAVSFGNALSKVSFHVNEVRRHLEELTTTSKWAFAGLTGLFVGATAAASPEMFATLTHSFAWLSAEIGRSFVPYMIEAARTVQDLARWFRDLSPGTKDAVAKFLLLGIAITGTVVAVGVIGGVVLNFIKVMQGLVALTTLYLGRSAAIVAAHEAEAIAANTAAAAETRLAGARAGGAGAAAGGAARGIGGAAAGAGLGAAALGGVGISAAIYGVVKIGETISEAVRGLTKPEVQLPGAGQGTNRLFNASRNVVRMSYAGEWLDDWLSKKFGFGTQASGISKSDSGKFLPSLTRQPWMGGVADAWKQAQMSAVRDFGASGEKMKVQQDSLQELMKANGFLSQMVDQQIGPN